MLGLTGFWICLNMPDYVWLNMHGYVWICQYMREYAQICLNGFCFIFPYCNALSPWTRAYLFQRLHKTRSFHLKENDAVFLDTNIDFSTVAVIIFGFCFRLDIFTNKISNLLLTLEVEGGGGCESGYPFFSLLLLQLFYSNIM